MTSTYHGGLPSSARNHFREPPSVLQRVRLTISSALSPRLRRLEAVVTEKTGQRVRVGGDWRRLLTLANVLTLFWVVVLYRGERSSFRSSVEQCDWANWESWPDGADPHRLVFVADPQLVDPHTYPGRPWPLSALTVVHTDLYLRRAFSQIQTSLHPDTVIFLGDLFDGGREWSTDYAQNPDRQWQRWGQNFWLREYARFGRIFFDHWNDGGRASRVGQGGRRLLAGLPGNHDLGFATGVHLPVRDRFNAYFGEGNRVDVIGNHTFVSIDSVSLSALGDQAEVHVATWKPTMDFLDGVGAMKRRIVRRELRTQAGLPPHPRYPHRVVDTPDLAAATLPADEDADDADLPTVLLSHVPLYRAPGTPCGPLRERYPQRPPPKTGIPPATDDRNAIPVVKGYQYQNVLDPGVTKDVTDRAGPLAFAFSGDDHDYCELVHRGYASAGAGIREVTVKSLSWAMGVRRPGFVLASLWNPVDAHGRSVAAAAPHDTLQSHLCLLPDQLGVLIRYGALFLVSAALIAFRAARVVLRHGAAPTTPTIAGPGGTSSILPLSRVSSAEVEKVHEAKVRARAASSATSSARASPAVGGYGLPQSSASRAGYGVPLINYAGYHGPPKEPDDDDEHIRRARGGRRQTLRWELPPLLRPRNDLRGWRLGLHEFARTLLRVAVVVFAWFFWLAR